MWNQRSHPGALGVSFLRDAARAGRVPQHFLVHGLLRSPLVRVLLHQFGQLGVDGLYETNKTKGARQRVFGWPRSRPWEVAARSTGSNAVSAAL